MGSTINPIYANLYSPIPGSMAPGIPGSSSPGSKSNPGGNPLLPNTNLSTSSVGSGNPYDVVPAGSVSPSNPGGGAPGAPSFPANSGGYSSTNLAGGSVPGGAPGGGTTLSAEAASSPFSFISGMSPTGVSNLYNGLVTTYGSGVAGQLMQFLMSGAGFNQADINNMFASLQPGIERGEENLMSQFSASGNRFGSGAQIGLGDFLSQVNLNEGQIESQMYQTAIDNFMNVLMGTSGAVAQKGSAVPTTFGDVASGLLGIGGAAVGNLDTTGSSSFAEQLANLGQGAAMAL